ncbi:hypothetical protein GH733_010817 [Mirounga leonina]|nr:hypothetical protein GH733_010817 [Mirounga leonina]
MSESLKFYHFPLVFNNFRKLIQVSSWQQNERDAVVQAFERSLPKQQAAEILSNVHYKIIHAGFKNVHVGIPGKTETEKIDDKSPRKKRGELSPLSESEEVTRAPAVSQFWARRSPEAASQAFGVLNQKQH